MKAADFELVICELAGLYWPRVRLIINGLEAKDVKNPGVIFDWQLDKHS